MGCEIRRDSKNNITKVIAENGRESILFNEIVNLGYDKESALKKWALVYTPTFKEWFGKGSVDANGEPQIFNLATNFASEITYTDEEGNPCAKTGLTNSTKGSGWKIVKDFKGQPTHSQGGVDITISGKNISMRKGGKDIKAAHGLLIAANGLSIGNDNPPIPPEYEAMSKVLTQRNKNLDWVDRANNPDKYPVKNQKDFMEGDKIISHRLAYATGDNGEAYVYPTVIYKDGSLIRLSDDEAMENSRKEGQFIKIPNVKLAEYYSQNGLIKH